MGVWIEHEPEFRVFVAALPADVARVTVLLKTTRFASVAQVVEVERSRLALAELSTKVRDVSPVPIETGIFVSERAYRVKVFVAGDADRQLLDDALAAAGLAPSSDLKVETVEGLSQPLSHVHDSRSDVHGGLQARPVDGSSRGCTTGFSVRRKSDGRLGVLTSGHCPNQVTINGLPAPLQDEKFGGKWDVQWHTVPDRHITNEVYVVGDMGYRWHQRITGTLDGLDVAKGTTVCKSGRSTNYTCGKTTGDKDCHLSDEREGISCTATYVEVLKDGRRPMARRGDSGAPVFIGPDAVGTLSTGRRNGASYMAYMPIEFISDLGLEVLTSEPRRPSPDDIAAFYDFGAGARILTWLSRGSSFAYRGSRGWWGASKGYSLEQVAGRMVAGDFDGDGDDDVAVFYDYHWGAARIHVWLSTGSSFSYRGNRGWWRTDIGYYLVKVADRMIVGDFNGDLRDDIATFYDYYNGAARVHVWLSTGSSFSYRGSRGWWGVSSGYWLRNVGDRMVAGDFGR